MTGDAIRRLHAREILDSRGRPTVEVDVELASGAVGRASVPSGASTGAYEAHELRDRDPNRYAGLGVRNAVRNVNGEIATALQHLDAGEQRRLDDAMRELDGTPQLRRLGANATLAVSLAACRAVTASRGQPLYERIAELSGARPLLPLPMTNILSGGLHAGRGMDVQDFLAIPLRAASIGEAIHVLARVRSAASDVMRANGLPTLLADEGGLSPGCGSGRAALELMMQTFDHADLRAGEDVAIAIDVAASTFRNDAGEYRLAREARVLSADEMIDMVATWADAFPVVSIEDALGDEAWPDWRRLTARLGDGVQLVGDDLFATNPQRVAQGIRDGVGNAVLVKPNQNGTLTGTLDVIAQAKAGGYATIVSARSGETEDTFMSDLAVGSSAGQIKIGSLRTSNTVGKYNQLLRIEESSRAAYAGAAALRKSRG